MSSIEIEKEAVDFFMGIMMDIYDGVSIHHRFLCTKLRYASEEVMDYMNEVYPVDFFYFFTKHKDIFNIDGKGNVSLRSADDVAQKVKNTSYYPNACNMPLQSINDIKEKTISYFRNILLECYSMPVQYIYLRGHLGQATYDIIDYVRDEYPMNNFLFLFMHNSNIFHVDNQGNVSLQSSNNKKKNTENCYGENYRPLHSPSSQGSSSGSSSGPLLESFTVPRRDAFNYGKYQYSMKLQANAQTDNILLQSSNAAKAVEYFKNVISELYSGPVYFRCLQGHLNQATEVVINYIRNVYPKDDFQLFFKNNSSIFQVDAGGNVSLLPCADATEEKAVEYFKAILLERYSQPVLYTCLREHLGQATEVIVDFLRETYPNKEFLSFFKNHGNIFHVDDVGNVSLQLHKELEKKIEFVKGPIPDYCQTNASSNAMSPQNNQIKIKAVEYFKNILSERYSEPIHYSCLQGHLGQATGDIIDYLRELYPKTNFLLFFKNNDDAFEVDDSGNVSLQGTDKREELAVDYFKNILSERYTKPVLYKHLRGHLGQATDNIIDFINDTYPKNAFLSFFKSNDDVFHIDAGGYVSLQDTDDREDLAVDYFKNILFERYSNPVLYEHLRGHLGQATDDIIDFINDTYPKDMFLSFFTSNDDVFYVDTGYVSLQPTNMTKNNEAAKSMFSECYQTNTSSSALLLPANSIEVKAAEYFKNILLERYTDPVLYRCLRGHLGQASDDIVDYIRDVYPKDDFLSFFSNNDNIFQVHTAGYISLKQCLEQETVEYFKDILLNRYTEPVFYEHLRGHLGQASDEIRDYVKTTYPSKKFLSFFLRNGNTFRVSSNGYIAVN